MGGEAKGVNSTLFSKVLWGQQAINYCVCVCVEGSGAVWVGRFTEPISVGTELVLYFPNPSVFKEETETEKKR